MHLLDAIHTIRYIHNAVLKTSTDNLNGVQAEEMKGLE